MPQPDLDYFRKRNLMIVPQPMPGVAPAFNGASDGFRFFDGSSSTEFDKVERDYDKAHFGNSEFGVANKRGKIEGEFELWPPATPGGAAASDAFAARVLLPAGMAVVKDSVGKTTRYNPVSAAIPMIAARFNHTGQLLEVLDGRVDISSLAIEIAQRFKAKASILGDYTEVIEAVAPTLTLPTKKPVTASKRNTTCVLNTLVGGGTKSTAATPLADLLLRAKSLSVNFGNDLAHTEYTGYGANRIKDRKATFTLKIAKTDITADFNPWFVRDNATLITVALALYEQDAVGGVHSGLYSTLAVRGQIDTITNTDSDGDMGWEITGNCVPSDAGGDEFHIEFGDKTAP